VPSLPADTVSLRNWHWATPQWRQRLNATAGCKAILEVKFVGPLSKTFLESHRHTAGHTQRVDHLLLIKLKQPGSSGTCPIRTKKLLGLYLLLNSRLITLMPILVKTS